MAKKNIPGTGQLYFNRAGTFRLNDGTVVQGGQYFRADPETISPFFKDTISMVDEELKPDIQPKVKHKAKKRATGWYDVIGPNGEPVNQLALRKQEAQQLVKELNG